MTKCLLSAILLTKIAVIYRIKRNRILAFIACDISTKTGEGYLANALINYTENISFKRKYVYTDVIVRLLRKNEFFRDRVLPFYLFVISVFLLLIGHRVVVLNYVPIWNFLNAILVRFGAVIGPVTGSLTSIPHNAGIIVRFLRGTLQLAFARVFRLVYPANEFIWAATKSVSTFLGQEKAIFGLPYIFNIKPLSSSDDMEKYDIFVYSSNHPIKNHKVLTIFLDFLQDENYKVCYVGPEVKSHNFLCQHKKLCESEFNQKLAQSNLYLSFSYEDSGITGLKAMASKIPILCPKKGGLSKFLKQNKYMCFDDINNFTEILSKIKLVNKNSAKLGEYTYVCFNNLLIKSEHASCSWLKKIK